MYLNIVYYQENSAWDPINYEVFDILLDYLTSPSKKIVEEITENALPDPNDPVEGDSEVILMIKELITTRIRPTILADGGDILYRGFDESTGVVSVELTGACVGCGSSSITLKHGVEKMLKHYIPEVKLVHHIQSKEELSQEQQKIEQQQEIFEKEFNKQMERAIREAKEKRKNEKK